MTARTTEPEAMPEQHHAQLLHLAVGGITVLFALWAAGFIYRASFVGLDGQRYYSLFDDAMISMRYAWNLAHGYGLVWNPGERVEGYTNLLMVLLMAIPNLVMTRRIAALAMQLLGVLFMLGNAFLAMNIAFCVVGSDRSQRRWTIGVLSFAATLAYYPLTYWSLMGMETGLLALLILLGVLGYLRFVQDDKLGWLIAMSLALGLAFLARPDSLVMSLPILALALGDLLARSRGKAGRALPRLFLIVGLIALLPIAQLGFRLAYYQRWLPNTYLLKLVGVPLGIRLTNGLSFLRPFLPSVALALGMATFGLVSQPRKWKALFLGMALSTMAYQVWVGGDPWPYWRIMAPTFPLVFISFIHGVSRLAENGAPGWRPGVLACGIVVLFGLQMASSVLYSDNARLTPGIGPADALLIALSGVTVVVGLFLSRLHSAIPLQYRFLSYVVLLSILGLTTADIAFLPEALFRVRPYTVQENISMVNRAIAVSEVTTAEASVGVFYAGAIPYYTGLYAIDFLGRSDERIARLMPDLSGSTGWYGMTSVPGHNKYDLYHSIVELAPTYIQNSRWGAQDVTEWVEENYATVSYRGIVLRLRLDDPNVLWDVFR